MSFQRNITINIQAATQGFSQQMNQAAVYNNNFLNSRHINSILYRILDFVSLVRK
jgi:hypothetical protein